MTVTVARSKPIDHVQLIQELTTAGVVLGEDGIGTIPISLTEKVIHTYDAEHQILQLPASAQAIADAHVSQEAASEATTQINLKTLRDAWNSIQSDLDQSDSVTIGTSRTNLTAASTWPSGTTSGNLSTKLETLKTVMQRVLTDLEKRNNLERKELAALRPLVLERIAPDE